MAPSKSPKDVLALGQHLVHAFGLEDGVDTLGRWMAHHLAELLAEVENCHKASDRRAAERRAMSAILRIWEHRQQLPGTAYPLSEYRKATEVLAAIHVQSNRFGLGRRLGAAGSLGLTFDVYSAASRLARFALLDLLPERKSSLDPAAVALLEAEEKAFLETIEDIYKLNMPSSEGSKGKKARTNVAIDLEQLRHTRLELVVELAKDIEKLKEALTGNVPLVSAKPASEKRSGTRKS
jgi:hypothetical protein